MRVFVTREIPGPALGRLRAEHDVTVWPGRLPPPASELIAEAAESDGLITLLTDRIDDHFLAACPRLRAVSNYAVGFENIDIAAATSHGVPVGHTPGVLTGATAQLTLTLILDLIRRVSEASRAVHDGDWLTWEPSGFLGAGLADTTLGLVGYGRIGRAVAELATRLGMRVLFTSQHAGGMPLEDLLGNAGIVSLHAPLTPATRHLMDARALGLMSPGSLLVNVARGPMVDTGALVDALRAGHIGGAALDVTDPEPLPPDHELLSIPNVIVTPHIASATVRTRHEMADLAVANLLDALRGQQMPHCANPDVYQSPASNERRSQ